MQQTVSKATLGRLPMYLTHLRGAKTQTISATALSKALGLGDVQVRKDLNAASGEGKPKIGYVVADLIDKLESCIGVDTPTAAVLVGAGKLGRALYAFDGFAEYGLEIVAAFDSAVTSPQVERTGKPIYPMSALPSFLQAHPVKIGILTVPDEAAQAVCDTLVSAHVAAIWSFAPGRIHVPPEVAVRQENLPLSLAHLSKQIQ